MSYKGLIRGKKAIYKDPLRMVIVKKRNRTIATVAVFVSLGKEHLEFICMEYSHVYNGNIYIYIYIT
jgi:hypothetical protein